MASVSFRQNFMEKVSLDIAWTLWKPPVGPPGYINRTQYLRLCGTTLILKECLMNKTKWGSVCIKCHVCAHEICQMQIPINISHLRCSDFYTWAWREASIFLKVKCKCKKMDDYTKCRIKSNLRAESTLLNDIK